MRDNQPKHRQHARERRKLERKQGIRKGYPTALIVCEGRKTEPAYLTGLIEHLGVYPANVRLIPGTSAADAVAVINLARDHHARTPDFDRVFAVIDAEQHNLAEALRLAHQPLQRDDGVAITIEPILSTPCFEVWLLLHFIYTARPYPDCAAALAELNAYLPGYAKGDPLIFQKVKDGLDRALAHAQRLKRELANVGARNPDTDMPSLVQGLSAMRRSP